MQSKIQEDELGPFEFHLFWGTFSTGSVFAGFLAGSCPAHKACRSRCC